MTPIPPAAFNIPHLRLPRRHPNPAKSPRLARLIQIDNAHRHPRHSPGSLVPWPLPGRLTGPFKDQQSGAAEESARRGGSRVEGVGGTAGESVDRGAGVHRTSDHGESFVAYGILRWLTRLGGKDLLRQNLGKDESENAIEVDLDEGVMVERYGRVFGRALVDAPRIASDIDRYQKQDV